MPSFIAGRISHAAAIRACGELNREAGEIFPKLPGYETKHSNSFNHLASFSSASRFTASPSNAMAFSPIISASSASALALASCDCAPATDSAVVRH
jgi:hypothetical protein